MNNFSYTIPGSEAQLPFYLAGIGMADKDYRVKREEGYPYHQIIYTVKGEGVLLIGGKQHAIKPGMGFYLPPDVSHEYYTDGQSWDCHHVIFSGSSTGDLMKLIGFDSARVFKISDTQAIDALFKKMLHLVRSDYFYSGYQCSAMLYQFLLEINRYVNLHAAAQDAGKLSQLKPVIDYIDKNYGKDIALQDLAGIINLSPQYLCRLFKECYDMRPFEYLTRKRINQAKNLLISSELTVNEISAEVGYNDCSYFCAVFKKHEMLSPIEFRSLHKKA